MSLLRALGHYPRPPDGMPSLKIFGDGSDGALVVIGTTTLAADGNYTTVDVQSGGILDTGGYRIRARQFVLIDGTVRNNGTNGVGSNQPQTAGAPGNTLASGGDGGQGADAGGGRNGEPGNLDSKTGGGETNPFNSLGAGGGGRGGGATDGGQAGSGGGEIEIYAPRILGTGTIEVIGGNGGNVNSVQTGGGGGGGGRLRGICFECVASVTVDVSGGTGGTNSGAGGDGADGSDGIDDMWILDEDPA